MFQESVFPLPNPHPKIYSGKRYYQYNADKIHQVYQTIFSFTIQEEKIYANHPKNLVVLFCIKKMVAIFFII